MYTKKEKTYPAKHNSNRQKQLILFMILNGEGWHYLEIKRLLALLNHITVICVVSIAFILFQQKTMKKMKNFVTLMPSEDTKIL